MNIKVPWSYFDIKIKALASRNQDKNEYSKYMTSSNPFIDSKVELVATSNSMFDQSKMFTINVSSNDNLKT